MGKADKLKPCPICGSEVDVINVGIGGYTVVCHRCRVSMITDNISSRNKAIERWNKIANEPPARKAKPKPKWIPIEQQKPPEHDWYFVFFPANKEQGTIDYVDVCFWDGTSFVDSGIGYKEDGIGYTHWMPLPEMPKG